ncbi:MAG: DUF969 domain-containing protein [Blastocatellia bacterium]|nr:DUF969 domain-containing protein [Blastocatellia bacterium]
MSPVYLLILTGQGDWKVLGIGIVLLGLFMRWKTGPVVLIAGITTGLLAGFPLVGTALSPGIIPILGKAFLDNRIITLYLLTLPVVGLAERFGLHQQAAGFIGKLRNATFTRLLLVFQALRILLGLLGIRLYGHTVFSRPVVYPMALTLTPHKTPPILEKVKAAVSACENYGNFFGQNLFPASAGCLLVFQTLKNGGLPVTLQSLSFYALPIVVTSFCLAGIQYWRLEHHLQTPSARSLPESEPVSTAPPSETTSTTAPPE